MEDLGNVMNHMKKAKVLCSSVKHQSGGGVVMKRAESLQEDMPWTLSALGDDSEFYWGLTILSAVGFHILWYCFWGDDEYRGVVCEGYRLFLSDSCHWSRTGVEPEVACRVVGTTLASIHKVRFSSYDEKLCWLKWISGCMCFFSCSNT